ncbi:MAG: hypothetical protein ACREBE_17795, partial [bacterium]
MTRTDHQLRGRAVERRVDQVDPEATRETFDVDIFRRLDAKSPQELVCLSSGIFDSRLPQRHCELLLGRWPQDGGDHLAEIVGREARQVLMRVPNTRTLAQYFEACDQRLTIEREELLGNRRQALVSWLRGRELPAQRGQLAIDTLPDPVRPAILVRREGLG